MLTKWWDKLQNSESYIVARARATIFALGIFGSMEAHAWAEGLGWPESEIWLRRVFAVCMIVSLLLRAGEKNDRPASGQDQPPRGFAAWPVLLVVALTCLSIGVLTWGLTHAHRRLAAAEAAVEQGKLALAHQVVATEDTRRELQSSVADLLAKNAELQKAYDEARAAAPSARPVAAASLDTGPVLVGLSNSGGAVEGPPAPPECKPGEILYPGDKPGVFTCGGSLTASAPAPKVPALYYGDSLSIQVDQVVLETDQQNKIIVGTARVWRETLPRQQLAEGRFRSPASTAESQAPPPEPRWGAAVVGYCGGEGCGPGIGVLLPPFRLPLVQWRAEGALAAVAGPRPGALGFLGVRW